MTAPDHGLDVARIQADFPILKRQVNGKRLVYLDSAASAQKPLAVLDAMETCYREYYANVHRGVYTIAEEATAAYEAARLPVMNEVILRNRELGPEIVMQMAEERAPGGFARIDDVIPRQELEEIAREFKRAAGFDRETLNRRKSLDVPRPSPSAQ